MAVRAVKKITLKEILKGKPDRIEIEIPDPDRPGKTKPGFMVDTANVAIIRGQIMDFAIGTTQFGSYAEFVGRIQAVRIKDGETFESTRVILPGIAEDILRMGIQDLKASDPMAMLGFAFILGVEHDARGTEGYKWTVTQVNAGGEQIDPLAAIRAASDVEIAKILAGDKAKLTDRSASPPLLDAVDKAKAKA